MTKIKNRDITDRWIAAFEKGKPFTPSEKRMMGIKLAQLKKNIKSHLESTGRQTELPVEQIIMDALEFSVMTNQPFRSIASLGYQVLDPSLDYWEKRRKLEAIKKEENIAQTKQYIQKENSYNQNSEKVVEEVIKNSYNKDTTNNTPAWMNNEGW